MDNVVVPSEDLSRHSCPLAVLKCVDFRFRTADQEFVEKGLGYSDFDLYAWPGAGKDILKDNGFKADFVRYILQVSKNLHEVKKLLLLWHWDCGAYGGSKNFASAEDQEEAYRRDLQKVRDMLAEELPEDLQILMAYSKPHPQGLEYTLMD